MKTTLFFMACFLGLVMQSNSQERSREFWEMMDDKNVNLKKVQKKAEEYFRQKGTGKGSGYKQYKRWEHERLLEIDENEQLPDRQVQWESFFQFKKSESFQREDDPSKANVWTELGPHSWNATSHYNPGMGRITTIAIDPSDESTIFIGSPGGGIWKTTDGGANWAPKTDHLPVLKIFSIAINPAQTNIILAGTEGGGIIKSLDGGETWVQTSFTSFTTKKIIFDPDNPNTVLIASSDGIYKSTDQGDNYQQVQTGSFNDIDFKPGQTSSIYACGYDFYKSTNGGDSFHQITNGINSSGRSFLAVTPANDNYVYLVQARGSEFGYLYRSTNSGDSFETQVIGNPANGTNYFGYSNDGTSTGGQAWYDMAITASPYNAETIFIGGINNWRSINGGQSFEILTQWSYPNNIGYTHPDIHALESVGNTIYCGSDGGIFKSTNNGEDWSNISFGLGIRQFYRIGGIEARPYYIGGGSQDNGQSLLTANDKNLWLDWAGADGMEVVIDYNDPDVVYGCFQNGGLWKSTTGGNDRINVVTPAGSGLWVTPLVIDPADPKSLYLGYNDVWKSSGGAGNWQKISNFDGGGLRAIAIAPSNNQFIYATDGYKIYFTQNGGLSWVEIQDDTIVGGVQYLSVHPTNPFKIALVTSLSVYKSDNGGGTWTDLTLNLPSSLTKNCITYQEDVLYVGLSSGVYYWKEGSSTWFSYGEGLPNTAVYELEVNNSIGMLRAATYGRGLWEAPVIKEASFRQPENPDNTENGLEYVYFEGEWSSLPDFASLTPVATGKTENFSIDQPERVEDRFAYNYNGFIDITTEGVYSFYTTSDDGSALFIGDQLVVDNDGLHGAVEETGEIALMVGKHAIQVTFFEATGGNLLNVSFEGPGIAKQTIPNENLYRIKSADSPLDLKEPEYPTNPLAGLDYAYYEGEWTTLPDFSNLSAVQTGHLDEISLSVADRASNYFGITYNGFIEVAEDGQYTFYTNSDDGSVLYIGDQLVVDNDGLHGAAEEEGTIGLKAGMHSIEVRFFERSGGELLNVSYAGPNLDKQLIPSQVLYRINTDWLSTLRDPDNPTSTIPGLNYTYIEGTWDFIPQFNIQNPVSGVASNFTMTGVPKREDEFAIAYEGYLDAPDHGDYTFFISSDDGSKLSIGNTVVVDNDGVHRFIEKSGEIGLKAGKHLIRVTYFDKYFNDRLTVEWSGPGLSRQTVPASSLFREAPASPGFMPTEEENTAATKSILSPNPVNKYFELAVRQDLPLKSIKVVNSNGVAMPLAYKEVDDGRYLFDTSNLPLGFYVIHLISKTNNIEYLRFIKQK